MENKNKKIKKMDPFYLYLCISAGTMATMMFIDLITSRANYYGGCCRNAPAKEQKKNYGIKKVSARTINTQPIFLNQKTTRSK